MDHLWSPWRYKYVTKADKPGGCVFCRIIAHSDDEETFVLLRGKYNFAVLNLYPYTNGHLMIVPYDHVATLGEARTEVLAEMIELTQRAEVALTAVYQPGGVNIGMNVGECAGAGVAGHIHMHVLPRWSGDSNFMTVVAEARVHIEDLAVTWRRLSQALRK